MNVWLIVVVAVLAGMATGCGEQNGQPLIEQREREEREAIFCAYPESEAKAHGADAYELWLLKCG